jgi:hypothetical protein
MANAAKRQELRFIGQILLHLSPDSARVWDLDHGCAYQSYGAPIDGLPVGSIVDCTLSKDCAFVEEMRLADDDIRSEYRRKLIILP